MATTNGGKKGKEREGEEGKGKKWSKGSIIRCSKIVLYEERE